MREQTRPLAANALPTESGFCIEHALIRDPYQHRGNESVVMFAGLPGRPDVDIVFSSMAGTTPAPGLLARIKKTLARVPILRRLAVTNLREGQRTIRLRPHAPPAARGHQPVG